MAARYTDPKSLAVQVWQGNDTLVQKPWVDAAGVATEADQLLDSCCPPSERTSNEI